MEHIVRNSNADEERLALERQPSISWADVAHQSFLPRTMHRSRTCGLVQPWQIVLESQRGPRSPALNAVISASSLQAFAREAPEEVRARLLVEGAGQYGKSLRLVNTLLKNGATVRLFSYNLADTARVPQFVCGQCTGIITLLHRRVPIQAAVVHVLLASEACSSASLSSRCQYGCRKLTMRPGSLQCGTRICNGSGSLWARRRCQVSRTP